MISARRLMHFQNGFIEGVSRILFSLMIFTLLLIGCSKNKGVDSPFTGDMVNLSVLVQGVKSPDISSSLRASIGNQVGLDLPMKRHSVTLSEDDVFYDIISEEEDLPSDIDFNSSINGKVKYATDVPMESGIKYRLMLYNATSDDFYVSIEATVGQTQHISVIPGQEYKWYAYSYNTNTAIAPPANLNNPSIMTPTETTLLYASGTIIATTDDTALPITFAHQLTQLRVEVKEGIRSILATVGSFGQSDYIQTCSFNLKDGTKGTLSSVNRTSLQFSAYTKDDTVMRVAQYYTANDEISSYDVNISSINLQYTSTSTRLLDAGLPGAGNLSFNFPTNPSSKKGYVLKGALKLSFLIPEMKIQTFSNSANDNGYRLGPTTNAYLFLMDANNFGGNANSTVKSKSFNITPPTSDNLGDATNAARTKFNNLMNNPATYPDILIFANYHDYASYEGHELMNKFLLAGGGIFYTHDDASLEDADKGSPGLSLILDSPNALLQKNSENYSVYPFVNTLKGANDRVILGGPFQPALPAPLPSPTPTNSSLNSPPRISPLSWYYWGQDRIGTSYVTNISNQDIIIYSNQPSNHAPNTFTNQGCFLRHNTKNFFFAGDGGFFLGRPAYATSTTREPFRITATSHIPVLEGFGNAYSGSSAGSWQIANSYVFGNAIAYMMNRIHYYGINRTGGVLVVPDPTGPDDPNNGPPD